MTEEDFEFIGPIPQRECTICREFFRLHLFRKHAGSPLGVSSGCKECLNKAGRQQYLSRKEDPYADSRFTLCDGYAGPVPQKLCNICGEFMTLDNFNKHHASRFNRSPSCKVCQAKATKIRRVVTGSLCNKRSYDKQTPERRLELNGMRQRARLSKRKNDPRTRMIQNAQNRCRVTGREFSIRPVDIELPAVCPVFGIPLTNESTGTSIPYPNSYSLDRMDNERGYVPGNVKVISYRANALKSDATVAELEAIVAYMKANLPVQRDQSQQAALSPNTAPTRTCDEFA